MEKKWWKTWLKDRWYEALVILVVGGILLYCCVLQSTRSIDGILVKTDSGELYLLKAQETYDDWGRITFTLHGRALHLEKFNTGDRVKLKGNIDKLESWPVQYANVNKIILDQPYDEESLQTVRDAVLRLVHGCPWDGSIVYPE